MNALVSGGAGFIGSNLAEALVQRGDRVRVLDNLSTGKRENLAGQGKDIELVEGDIRSYHTVREALEGIEVVFHEAALPSVPRSVRDPVSSNAVNVDGTLNILYAAKDARVRRVVYASSSSVYGDTPELPKHEGMTPNPQSPYAVSKLAAEHYCRVFAGLYDIETVALRYFNVFGPRQDPASQYSAVIPKFIKAMLNGERPVIFGDGEQTRDFTFVTNVVDANMRAATAACRKGLAMNCACHDRVSLNQLVAEINKILETSLEPVYDKPRAGDIKHSFAAIDLATREIAYVPAVEFREGLRRTVAWYRERFRPAR